MEVRGGKGQKAYVKFTMHSKGREQIAKEGDGKHPTEVEEKLFKKEINLVRDSDDTEDMLVPEVLMDSDDSDTELEDMPLLLRRLLF